MHQHLSNPFLLFFLEHSIPGTNRLTAEHIGLEYISLHQMLLVFNVLVKNCVRILQVAEVLDTFDWMRTASDWSVLIFSQILTRKVRWLVGLPVSLHFNLTSWAHFCFFHLHLPLNSVSEFNYFLPQSLKHNFYPTFVWQHWHQLGHRHQWKKNLWCSSYDLICSLNLYRFRSSSPCLQVHLTKFNSS